MSELNDPRVFFAAERTLLAWVRTGLSVIGLGFVEARFGIFLRMLHGTTNGPPHIGSTLIGVGLVLLGSACIAMAARQHSIFCRSLKAGEIPQPNLARWSVWFASLLSLIGTILAIYILVRSRST